LDGCWLPRARRPAGTTRVPYTTLFRSLSEIGEEVAGAEKKKNITVIKNQTNFFYSPKEDSSSIVLTDGTLGSCMNSGVPNTRVRSEEHTSELQSRFDLVCRLLLEKKTK